MTQSSLRIPAGRQDRKTYNIRKAGEKGESGGSHGPQPSDQPCPLPFCAYPTAADVAHHGLQPLPAVLPLVDFARAQPFRSRQYAAVPAATLTSAQVLEMAQVVGASFARREPQTRHLQLAKHPPPGLMETLYADPFGWEAFGPWTKANILSWFIRLFILTDPTSPQDDIRVNEEALAQSPAILDSTGQVIGGAFNEPLPASAEPPALRQDDPFLNAVLASIEPIMDLLGAQDTEAISALCAWYPAFQQAYAAGKVGHHFMVARSDALPKADTFELVAASAAHYQALGYAYMVIEASNQWTGAACEALGGVRVHFAPYQARQTVCRSPEPLDNTVTSPTGFLSDKDSGCMFYVIRLG